MRWPFIVGVSLLALGCNSGAGKEGRDGVPPVGPAMSAPPPNAGPYAIPGPGTSMAEGAPPNVIRYPMPFLAKPNDAPVADQASVLKFQAENGASAEVEAVCEVKPSGNADCWHADGSAYPEFTKRIEARYKSASGVPIPHDPHFKNRLVIARVGVPGWNGIQLKSVGSNHSPGGVDMDIQSPRLEGEPAMFFAGGFVAEPLGAKATSMRFTLSLPLEETPIIACKPGARVTFGGDTFVIRDVHQGRPSDLQYNSGGELADKWYVSFERTVGSARDKMLLIVPIDVEGHRIAFVDEEGTPIAQEALGKMTRNPHHYRASEYNIMNRSAEQFTLVLNFDPAKVGRLRFEGFTSRLVDLTGIPLDPSGR